MQIRSIHLDSVLFVSHIPIHNYLVVACFISSLSMRELSRILVWS